MDERLFNVLMLFIPVVCVVITGYIIPYIKLKMSTTQLDEIGKWVEKAVACAEIIFDVPKSGAEKREYVINFIDKTFNSKKQVITRSQINILLEAAVKQMHDTATELSRK